MKYRYSRKKIAKSMDSKSQLLSMTSLRHMLLEEKKEWPQDKDRFWYVDSNGVVENDYWVGGELDISFKVFGNCFRTKREAKKVRDRMKSLLSLIRVENDSK